LTAALRKKNGGREKWVEPERDLAGGERGLGGIRNRVPNCPRTGQYTGGRSGTGTDYLGFSGCGGCKRKTGEQASSNKERAQFAAKYLGGGQKG